jgi:hypothetical protein
MSCLPCARAEIARAKEQGLINQAIKYARDDAAATGEKSYKVVRLVNGGISWKRSSEQSTLEVIQHLYFH